MPSFSSGQKSILRHLKGLLQNDPEKGRCLAVEAAVGQSCHGSSRRRISHVCNRVTNKANDIQEPGGRTDIVTEPRPPKGQQSPCKEGAPNLP